MATHSSILAQEIPRKEEPGGLQSMDHEELDMTVCMHTHNLLEDFRTPEGWQAHNSFLGFSSFILGAFSMWEKLS